MLYQGDFALDENRTVPEARMSLTSLPNSPTSELLVYKDFKANLIFGRDDELIVVKLIGIPRLFRARNREVAEQEFRRIVDHELIGKLSSTEENFLKKDYSGNIALRMGSLLHQDLALAAHRSGRSLNTYIEEKLQNALEVEAIRDEHGDPLPKDKVIPPAVYQLIENEEAASLLFQEIQEYLEEKINFFQFPSVLKGFLAGQGTLLEDIKPYIKHDKLDEFVSKVTFLLQKFEN
jgi:predicted HicB family RNase H-like nuclease